MKLLIGYLHYRRMIILLLLIITVFPVLFMGLYGIPAMACVYAFSACAVIALAAGFADFVMYSGKVKRLRALENEITITLEHLPKSKNEIESAYQALLNTVFSDLYSLGTESEKKYNSMLTYFVMWTHQIKTPISAMSLILREQDTDESRELSENLQKIEQYVSMVLCYVQLDSDSNDFVIRSVSLDKIIKCAIHKFSPLFIRKKIELVYEPITIEVLTDEKWLQFVVEQLISNALKYTKKGKVEITLKPEKILSIRDTGIGIAPEDLPRVFECGFTGANGRIDKNATGIGLFLCKRICDALGHNIELRSDRSGSEVLLDIKAPSLDARD